MAASLQDTLVTYEELAELELEFDDVETEISESRLQHSGIKFCSMGQTMRRITQQSSKRPPCRRDNAR